jgi:hypothetical protein
METLLLFSVTLLWYLRMTEMMKGPESSNDCDHEWELVDDSFDHEYGCERIVYYVCTKCDAQKDVDDTTEWYDE